MKRRDFLKRSVVASTAVIVSGPTILLATKKKQLDKGIVYAPYIPIITASMPRLHPGEIGILYGLTGSGKSKVTMTRISKIDDIEIVKIKICDEVWRDGDYLQLRWYDEKQTETIFNLPTRTITIRMPDHITRYEIEKIEEK